ncbi:phosphotransferase [Candidatus Pelagibacter sp.]|nr:phosphotransferase [Candidatus Pelagibacter sp.]
MNLKKFKKLSGDASFRQFYRTNNSVLVYSKIQKRSNLLNYDAVNKILIKNKILAPGLISQNYKKNFIEIEDFGNKNMLDKIKSSKTKLNEYKKILKILYQIQKIKNFKTQNFLKKKFNLSNYSKAKILKESYLFLDWYLPANKLIIQKGYIKKNLKKIIDNLYLNLKIKQKVFVHRDFHVSNMMFYKNKIALIDSQDAVLGNPAYDLASLIDDVRIKTSNSFKSNILKVFLSKFKYKNKSQFINDFEILSVLRNLKIIGIFTRLANRDKKKKYLKLIPYAWKLIDNRMKNNSNFNDLIKFLKENPKIKKNEN